MQRVGVRDRRQAAGGKLRPGRAAVGRVPPIALRGVGRGDDHARRRRTRRGAIRIGDVVRPGAVADKGGGQEACSRPVHRRTEIVFGLVRDRQVDVGQHRRIVGLRHRHRGERAADHRRIGACGAEGHGARTGVRRIAGVVIGDGPQGGLPLRRRCGAAGRGEGHRTRRRIPDTVDVAHRRRNPDVIQHVLAVQVAARDGEHDLRELVVDQDEARDERDGAARGRRVVRLLEGIGNRRRRDLDANLRRGAGQLATGTLEVVAVGRTGLGVVVPQRGIDDDAAVERMRVARERIGDVVQDALHRRRIGPAREGHRERAAGHRERTDLHTVEQHVAAVEEQARSCVAVTAEHIATVGAAVADQSQQRVAVVAGAVGHQRIELGIGNAGAAGAEHDGRSTHRVLLGAGRRVVAPGRDDRRRVGEAITEIDARDRRRAVRRDGELRIRGVQSAFIVPNQRTGRAVGRIDQGLGSAPGRGRRRRNRSADIRGHIGRQQERIEAVGISEHRRGTGRTGPRSRQGDTLQPRIGCGIPSEILRTQCRAEIVPDIALHQAEADGRAGRIVVDATRAVALALSRTGPSDAVARVAVAVEVASCDEAVGVVQRGVSHRRRGVGYRLRAVGHRGRIGERLGTTDAQGHRGQQGVGAVARGNEQVVRATRLRQAADCALIAGQGVVEIDVVGDRVAVVGKLHLPSHLPGSLVDALHLLGDGDTGLLDRQRRVRRVGRSDRGNRLETGAALVAGIVAHDRVELDDGVVLDIRIGVVLHRAEVEGHVTATADATGDGSPRQCRRRVVGRDIEAARAAVDLDRDIVAGRVDDRRRHDAVGARQRNGGIADIFQADRQVDGEIDVVVEAGRNLDIDLHTHQLADDDIGGGLGGALRRRARRVGTVGLVDQDQDRRKHTDRDGFRGRNRVAALARHSSRHRGVGAGRVGRLDQQRGVGRKVVVDGRLEGEGCRAAGRQPLDRHRVGRVIEHDVGSTRRCRHRKAARHPGQAARQHDRIEEIFCR